MWCTHRPPLKRLCQQSREMHPMMASVRALYTITLSNGGFDITTSDSVVPTCPRRSQQQWRHSSCYCWYEQAVYTLLVISVSFYCQLLGCCLSSPPYTRYYSYSPVRVRGQGVRYVRDSAPQLTEDQEHGYEEETEKPLPEIDNIIEDSPSVTLIPLSIDTIEEEDIFTSTADTIPDNILPAGKHYY